jgi:hypothetical protein
VIRVPKSRTLVPSAVAIALVCAACSGSSHAPSAASTHYAGGTTSTISVAGGASGGSSTTTAPTSSTTVANHGNATSPGPAKVSGQSAGTTGSTSPTTAGAQPIPPSGNHPPTPARPGTYQEKQSGSFTAAGTTHDDPPTGRLVVDPATAQGQQTWHYYPQPNQGSQDTTLAFRPNGAFLVSTTESGPNGTVNCTFNPAIPAPPWPPAVGDSFSSTGNCGQFQLHIAGKITGTRTVILGGTNYTVWVVDSTLNATGQITATGTQEDWYSFALRLDLHESSQLQGSYGPFAFKSQLTTDLESANPT